MREWVFSILGLRTYLIAGPKEPRAWTIHRGWTAPQAAGVIHTDFQRGFIKAEILSFDDLIATGSMAAAKAAGQVRMEGKEYVMADGDVVEFRFGGVNVEGLSASLDTPLYLPVLPNWMRDGCLPARWCLPRTAQPALVSVPCDIP